MYTIVMIFDIYEINIFLGSNERWKIKMTPIRVNRRRAVGIGPKLGTSTLVDAARRGAAAAARSLSRRRRDEANALPAQRSPARSVRVRRFYSWSMPTPRLRTPKRRCRAMLCHAVSQLRADEPRTCASASESARADPSVFIRGCCAVRRGKWPPEMCVRVRRNRRKRGQNADDDDDAVAAARQIRRRAGGSRRRDRAAIYRCV